MYAEFSVVVVVVVLTFGSLLMQACKNVVTLLYFKLSNTLHSIHAVYYMVCVNTIDCIKTVNTQKLCPMP